MSEPLSTLLAARVLESRLRMGEDVGPFPNMIAVLVAHALETVEDPNG